MARQDTETAAHPRDNVAGLLPAGETGGETALALVRQAGPNMAPEDQQEAIRRFRAIEPILFPDHFPRLWLEAGRKKSALAKLVAAEHGVQQSTIYRWAERWGKGGLPALAPSGRSDKCKPRVLNPAALDFILGCALPKPGSHGEFSVKEIFRAYAEEQLWRNSNAGRPLSRTDAANYARYLDQAGNLRPEAQLPEASYRTFARWCHNIPEVLKVMARRGPDAFAASQDILSWRNIASLRPLQYVVLDHRLLDAFCLLPVPGGWRIGRPWLTACIDSRTRRWLGWNIVEVPSSSSIASVLKKVIFQHGIPEAALWDNGRDFRSHYIEGRRLRTSESHRVEDPGEMMGGIMAALGIRVHRAIVKRARAKIIEPCFLGTANFDRTLPYWTGHKPSARPERLEEMVREHELWVNGKAPRSPFVTIQHIAGLYDELLLSLNSRPHTGQGMEKLTATGHGWQSPNECWAGLIGDIPKRTAPPEVIGMAFQRRKALTVRNGEVCATFGGRIFHYRMTDEPLRLMGFSGQKVELAYDEHDLGLAAIYVDNRFLGLADAVALRNVGTRDFVPDEKNRRVARREVKAFIRSVHQSIPIPTAEERAARRAAVRPALMEPAREEVAAQMPAALIEAAAAIEQRRSFKFSEVPPDQVGILTLGGGANTATDPGEEEFNFFQRGNT